MSNIFTIIIIYNDVLPLYLALLIHLYAQNDNMVI